MESLLSNAEIDLFARHFSLPGFTHATQLKLKRARVLIVGSGGLGCPALTYLVGAGVGHIGIVDGDTVSASNIHRQTLFNLQDVGRSKVVVAAERLSGRSPETEIVGHCVFLDESNALEICRGYDVVLDGTDNFSAKYLLDATCEELRIPFVYASIFQFEGQLSVFHWQDDPAGPMRYRDLYPAPPPPNVIGNCNEAGVLGVLPGILGVMQANEVIKILTGIGAPLSSKLLTYDALTCQSSLLHLKQRGALPTVQTLSVSTCSLMDSAVEISALQLLEWLTEERPVSLIDVRSHDEHANCSIGGDCIPLPGLPAVAATLPPGSALVFYCQSGVRSRKAVDFMFSSGRTAVFSLAGGIGSIGGEEFAAFRRFDVV